jgi:hypothetical protein
MVLKLKSYLTHKMEVFVTGMQSLLIQEATEEVALSQSSAPQSFPNFSRLPFELRTKIWLMTFKSRILRLEVETHQTSHGISTALPKFPSVPSTTPSRSVAISFIPQLGTRPSYPAAEALPYPPDHPRDGVRRPGTLDICPTINRVVPSGPVALHVCHESRELAWKHYQLCFTGTNQALDDVLFCEQWNKGSFGVAKVWVNFKLDVVYPHSAYCYSHDSYPYAHVDLFTHYAPEETMKIRRFDVESVWQTELMGRTDGTFAGVSDLQKSLEESVGQFSSLREILIYHFSGHGCRDWWTRETREALEDEMKDNIEASLQKDDVRAAAWVVGLCHGIN